MHALIRFLMVVTLVSWSGLAEAGFRLCDRGDLENRSEEIQELCEALEGRSFADFLRLQRTRRTLERLQANSPEPVAHLEVLDRVGQGFPVRPGHVDLDASGSLHLDGPVNHYAFELFDADTGDLLGSVPLTRLPIATVVVNRPLPPRLLARVHVENGLGQSDTTDLEVPGPETTCGSDLFTCQVLSTATKAVECQPKKGINEFSTGDLLTAAQGCEASITADTPLTIVAWGGGGSVGSQWGAYNGGPGGLSGMAAVGTTTSSLDESFGTGTKFCYGLGSQGDHATDTSGTGGASTILRACNLVDQNSPNGVVLLAGGGGGGAAASGGGKGFNGGEGGRAFSTQDGACPPNCTFSTPGAGGLPGGAGGKKNGGGGGSGGNAGGGGTATGSSCQGTGVSAGGGQGGIGGFGGTVRSRPIPKWPQGDPKVTGYTGSGGGKQPGSEASGAGGGGGYGGGGASCGSREGGGGGGSYAMQSTISYTTPPAVASVPGALLFTFNP